MTAATLLLSTSAGIAQDIPSVSVRPAEGDTSGPNEGAWFVLEGARGDVVEATAVVTNVADVPQDVEFEIRDLVFDDSGTPQLNEDVPEDIGAWGHVRPRSFRMEPTSAAEVTFTIAIPDDAEPGDHVGAFVARTSAVQGNMTVVREVARRIYVTVPGEAERSFVIAGITGEVDDVLWPRSTTVNATLRNDGRVRLRPRVDINGREARGSTLLLARSIEPYLAAVEVPWYGGPVRITVNAETESGPTRTATVTEWVIPWGLIILIIATASAMYAGRRWWKRRRSATAELKQDIQRLEQLITQQAKAQESTAAVGVGLPAADDVPEDEEAVLLAALKRARRSDDDTALARIALAKHMTSGDGLDLVLEALEEHRGKHREALLDAAVSYGSDALSTHERFSRLPDDVQTELGERLVTAGETVSGNGNGTPAKVPQPVVGETDSDALRTELAKVKGIGPAKQEALVSRFGSLDAIRDADVEILTDVPGIGYATAREILDQLNG